MGKKGLRGLFVSFRSRCPKAKQGAEMLAGPAGDQVNDTSKTFGLAEPFPSWELDL